MIGPRRALYPGFLQPLRDEQGRPYTHVPCQDRPSSWDDEADLDEKIHAAAACRLCPAIAPCMERRLELGAAATGVWAGEILSSTSEAMLPTVEDRELDSWAAEAGVTLRQEQSDTEAAQRCRAVPAEVAKPTTESSTEPRSETRSRVDPPGSHRPRRGSRSGASRA